MTKHILTKHKIQKIKRTEFMYILDEAMLSENERKMMLLYYVEKKDLGYIADTMGYTRAGIIRMHQRILDKIEAML